MGTARRDHWRWNAGLRLVQDRLVAWHRYTRWVTARIHRTHSFRFDAAGVTAAPAGPSGQARVAGNGGAQTNGRPYGPVPTTTLLAQFTFDVAHRSGYFEKFFGNLVRSNSVEF